MELPSLKIFGRSQIGEGLEVEIAIIHIGHGKTGSSVLQSFLVVNRDNLAKFGFDYPPSAFDDAARSGQVTSGNGGLVAEFHDLVGIPGKIFSSELLFFNEDLRQYLGQSSQSFSVLAYTRDLFHFLISAWGQRVKRHGATVSFEQFLESDIGDLHLAQLIRWQEALGDRLSVFNYSRHSANLEHHFLSAALGITETRCFKFFGSMRVNRSLTAGEREVQSLFNHFYGGSSSRFVSDQLVNLVPEIRADIPYFSRQKYTRTVDRLSPQVVTINQSLPLSERIQIEPYGELVPNDRDREDDSEPVYAFTRTQLKVLVKSISDELKRGHSAPSD